MANRFSRFLKDVFRQTAVLIAVGMLSTTFFLMVGPMLLKGLADRAQRASVPVVEDGSLLVIDLSFNLVETEEMFDPGEWMDAAVGGGAVPQVTLFELLRTVEAAASDERISGIYLRGNLLAEGFGSGPGAVEELRGALERFRAAGKPVHGHFTYAGVLDYYLYSVCDRLYVSPMGGLDFNGIGGPQLFFGRALKNWGISVQAFQAGEFKSAIEPFVRDSMTEENRKQTARLLEGMWTRLSDGVALGRKMNPERLRETVAAEPLLTAEWAVENGLADQLAGEGEVIRHLVDAFGEGKDEGTFPQIARADYSGLLDRESDWDQPYVAIVTLEGEMLSGEGFIGTVGGDAFARELRFLQSEENLRAVVLRINSPGGSAEAAETLHREIRTLARQVPVIVSMGSYAASGGYWVSTQGARIYANPTTITGSIGVFGLHVSLGDLAARLDLAFDGVQTGPYTDAGSLVRPLSEPELAAVERHINEIYRQFLDRVGDGRGMDRADLKPLAEGRVWTGADALDLGLVDAEGGLRTALVAALEAAGMDAEDPFSSNIVTIPERYTAEDFFQDLIAPPPGEPPVVGSPRTNLTPVARIPGGISMAFVREPLPEWSDLRRFLRSLNDPNGTYVRLPWVLRGTVRQR